jgi:signal recognition particle GTPase
MVCICFTVFLWHLVIFTISQYGDVRGLMDAFKLDQDHNSKQSKEELMEKMSKGEFTLRDMYKQFEKILNLGVSVLKELMALVGTFLLSFFSL